VWRTNDEQPKRSKGVGQCSRRQGCVLPDIQPPPHVRLTHDGRRSLPITIAQTLGHSSTQIVPRYAQVLDQNRFDAMKKMESLRQTSISNQTAPMRPGHATGHKSAFSFYVEQHLCRLVHLTPHELWHDAKSGSRSHFSFYSRLVANYHNSQCARISP
jgi:predicted nucleic acid-binding protein